MIPYRKRGRGNRKVNSHGQCAASLLEKWLNEENDYDEKVWKELKGETMTGKEIADTVSQLPPPKGKGLLAKEDKKIKSLDELIKLTKGETRLLYHLNYWDGPLSGIMLWDGEKAYFEFYKEKVIKTPFTEKEKEEWKIVCKKHNWKYDKKECIDYEYKWFYKVYRIPKETLKLIDKQHRKFRWLVGNHTDYNKNNDRERQKKKLKPYFLQHIFYKNRKDIKIEVDKCKIIGEFER